MYVRRVYRPYTPLSINYEEGDGTDDGEALLSLPGSSIPGWCNITQVGAHARPTDSLDHLPLPHPRLGSTNPRIWRAAYVIFICS
jgi:hypothetical protein